MSPSESDLRAALRDGEGDNLNVDRLILGAEADLAHRKTRLLTTAVVVGVLACAAVGGGFLASNSGGSSGSKSANGGNQAAAGGASSVDAYGTGGGSNGNGGAGSNADPIPGALAQGSRRGFAASSSVASCPTTVAAAAANAAKATDAVGTRVFTGQVTSVLLCTYGSLLQGQLTPHVPAPTSTTVVLRGAAASRLVASLERAPTSKPTGMCPLVRSAAASALLMIGLGPDGKVAGTASTVLGTPVCNVVVLSAGAPRYDWNPPADLGSALSIVPPTASATNRVHPSPISS